MAVPEAGEDEEDRVGGQEQEGSGAGVHRDRRHRDPGLGVTGKGMGWGEQDPSRRSWKASLSGAPDAKQYP